MIRANLGGSPIRVLFVEHDASLLAASHLFDFDTMVRYRVCPDNSVTFLSGSAIGTLDQGVITLLLEGLGFRFAYMPSPAPIVDTDLSAFRAAVPIHGTFNIQFSPFEIATKVVGFPLTKLAKPLAKRLAKFPRTQWAFEMIGAVDNTMAALEKAFVKQLSTSKVPEVLKQALFEAVVKAFEADFEFVKGLISNADFASLTPEEAVIWLVARIEGALSAEVELPVWTPVVIHDVTAANGFGFDNGWANPFLLITRARNEVVTGP